MKRRKFERERKPTLRFFVSLALMLFAASSYALGNEAPSTFEPFALPKIDESAVFEAPGQQQSPQTGQPEPPGAASKPTQTTMQQSTTNETNAPAANPQPKRILGIMPNFRAVSAGQIPPPPTPKQAFVIATKNSFDYSSFIFVGVTSAIAEWSGAHKQLGEGMEGYGRYYWRGLLDKTDGNYLVIFALPTVFHQDERYYAMGKGGFWKRFGYSISRVAVTPDYDGHNSFNISELLGRGMAQGISLAYYPSQTRTLGGISSKYGYAILRDAATNSFREFWPDIAVHVLHRHP